MQRHFGRKTVADILMLLAAVGLKLPKPNDTEFNLPINIFDTRHRFFAACFYGSLIRCPQVLYELGASFRSPDENSRRSR
jgi:hypothetical protein